jgi:hypothetical protein
MRLVALLAVVVIGGAAPARAWCEATCLEAPHQSAAPHCPSHESTDDGSVMSATTIDQCPVIDSARPTAPARMDAPSPFAVNAAPALRTPSRRAPAPARRAGGTTVLERNTPLRI